MGSNVFLWSSPLFSPVKARIPSRRTRCTLGSRSLVTPATHQSPIRINTDEVTHFSEKRQSRTRRGDPSVDPALVVNLDNLHRAAQPASVDAVRKRQPDRFPAPQDWVRSSDGPALAPRYWIAFKGVTASTNARTMAASMLPRARDGNTLPLLVPEDGAAGPASAVWLSLLLANLNALAFDYLARPKVQGQHLNWYILEQLPVIAPARFEQPLPAAFAARMRESELMNGHHPDPTVADFVIPQVLALSYTAHDLAPFARDLGYVDETGAVLPPIVWNDEDRRARLAALDALFMHLYGLGTEDAGYILDTFPIVRAQDKAAFGRYRTKDEVLALLPLLGTQPRL